MKPYELIPFADPAQLAGAAAAAWLEEVETARRARQPHSVALSGGRIAQQFFTACVAEAARRRVSLLHVDFFWADERCVPPTDAESNFRIARELLFEPLNIPAGRIHRIRGEDVPESAAATAELEMRRILSATENAPPVLDLIFLGLGEDGHVASLFPAEAQALVESPLVYRAITHAPKPPPNRITLGYPVLLAARQIWMLASGPGKESALRESLSPAGGTPFARILQTRSNIKIFTDILAK